MSVLYPRRSAPREGEETIRISMVTLRKEERIIYFLSPAVCVCDDEGLFTVGLRTCCSCCTGRNGHRHSCGRMFLLRHCSFRKWLLIFVIMCSALLYYQRHFSYTSSHMQSSSISLIPPTRIMYVTRTASHFYQTRLVYLLQTWVALVRDHAFFISDIQLPNIASNHVALTEKSCGPNSHSMSALCCKTAHDFILYRRYATRYDWFCHFDDDQYVNVNNLNEYLSSLDPDRAYYIGRNSWNDTLKRKKHPFPHPFWFATLGAGVCLSKRTLNLLEPHTRSVSQFVDGCIRENYHDDIYLGFLINNYLNVSLTKNLRFHSHLEKSLYEDKQSFLSSVTRQITFGFRPPHRLPSFLPPLFPSQLDPLYIRTLHCLLNTQLLECQTRIRQHLFNSTK